VAWLPGSARSWALLAQAERQRGRLAGDARGRRRGGRRATRAIDRAIALEPAEARYHLERAEILTPLVAMGAASREEALASIDAALAREPLFRPYRRAAVELSLQLGDPERAARYGEKLAREPRRAPGRADP
jgi:hypothetical protein